MSYLDACLRHKSEIVTYEAARAFCQLAIFDEGASSGHTVFGFDMTHATTILQIFLTSPKPVVRFGAVRTLNALAQQRPQMAARCDTDMEPVLADQNRCTATLALTTLLKIGHESSVERLVKQITTFMSDISDVFKIEVVRAVRALCLQYPSKYKTLMAFLSSNLREEGTAEFKTDLVDAIILIISKVPAAREAGLLSICEFIEDCEYGSLCTRVLSFLGEEVPNTSVPSKYIRFIYNRLILESSPVRAAAVDALAKIAVRCPTLRSDVTLLLKFEQNDNDDEVRDRILLYSSVLATPAAVANASGNRAEGLKALVSAELPFSVDALYEGLLAHVNSDLEDVPFEVGYLPTEAAYTSAANVAAANKEQGGKKGAMPGVAAGAGPGAQGQKAAAGPTMEFLSVVKAIIPLEELGPLQHTCKPKMLTESEAEYTVQVTKHMFKEHVLLEVAVNNTVDKITLEDIEVRLTGIEPHFREVGATKIDKLEFGQGEESAFVMLQKVSQTDAGALVGLFGAALHYIYKEEDDDLGYEDEYPVENVQIQVGDYNQPRALPPGQWKSVWEQQGLQGESIQQVSLNFKSVDLAVDGIMAALNMEACDRTGKAEQGVRAHTLNLSSTFLGGYTVLVKALIGMDPTHGCVAKVAARSGGLGVADVVARAIVN
eukprot:NODE_1000_length_2657_cov_12.162846.p1 GENE.NODE_1000_length_2657_cov_12.162846~~NODE_1000_length_2657_cov_12.162846.p1  ORF type:complete len:660 (+),score=200.88 NODE_1000_length_2657_cov_12.162846:499-2478(+)